MKENNATDIYDSLCCLLAIYPKASNNMSGFKI